MMLIAPATMALALAMAPSQAVQQQPEPSWPSLTVRGQAELDQKPDQLNLSIGVVTEAAEAAEAIEFNSEQMREVIAAIERLGLTDDDYETAHFRVQPQYSPRPRQADQSWRPRIVGYQVSNQLQVRTARLELAGELIDATTGAGANSIESIHFDLADHRAYRAEAITAATKNAIADAGIAAEAAGVRLVRIRSISIDDSGPRPMQPPYYARTMGAEAAGGAVPVSPGDVTVQAAVTIVYEIGD